MRLMRSFATVGGLTAVSRVLGYVRDVLIAAALGAGPVADAFFVAFRFPNLFRRLVGEGAFNAAFVPLFARRLEGDGQAAAEGFAEEALAALLAVLLAFTVVAMAAMPWLMLVLAPGFREDPEKFDLAVRLSRITTPYLLFMALFALLAGVLNSLYKFAAAAAAQVLLNVCLIAAVLVLAPLTGAPGPALAMGVLVGGMAQFLVLVLVCKRAGMRLALPAPRLTPGVRRLGRLMVPGLLGAGVLQVNIAVGTIIASLEGGAVSYLYYADRIQQLPLGLIGVAFAVVLLPDLSRKLRSGADGAAAATLNRGLEGAMLLTVPAAVAMAVMPWPIVVVLFERGAFDRAASDATATALAAYALGVPAFVLVRVLATGFFAREDTTTPLRAAVAAVAVNVAASLALFWWLGHMGIALAASLASWVNAAYLGALLRRQGFLRLDARVRRRWPRIVLASAIMGAALWWAQDALAPWLDRTIGWQVGALAILVALGLLVYGAAVLGLGAARPGELSGMARRPRGGDREAPTEAP
jgi:putative peptidoglycan lipid II flippase